MSYIRIETIHLAQLLSTIVGFEYKKNARNFYSILKQEIENSSYVPDELKVKDFSRVIRTMRQAIEANDIETTISLEFLRALYGTYVNDYVEDGIEDKELWNIIRKSFEDKEGSIDPLMNSRWNIYFLDNNTAPGEFCLIQGFLNFTSLQEVTLEYQTSNHSQKIRLVGRRIYLTQNTNILKIKLWTHEKHISEKEPYTIIECVVDSDKLQSIIEGVYLQYEGDNVIFSGLTLLTILAKNETHELKYLNLFDRSNFLKLGVQKRSVIQYFTGRHKNLLKTNAKIMRGADDLYEWIESREQNIYAKNIDLFISTPISVFDNKPGKIKTVAMVAFLLKHLFFELFGFENIFCAILDAPYKKDDSRYHRFVTLETASEKFRRSKRYLFLSPIEISGGRVSSAFMELGWAVMDRTMVTSYIMSCDTKNLPKYTSKMTMAKSNLGIAPDLEYAVDNLSIDQLWDYFLTDSMCHNLYDMSYYFGMTGLQEFGIREVINAAKQDLSFGEKLKNFELSQIELLNLGNQ